MGFRIRPRERGSERVRAGGVGLTGMALWVAKKRKNDPESHFGAILAGSNGALAIGFGSRPIL